MSQIRRQSIISSLLVYFGFALGFLNTYLFTREGSGFTKEEYGLTNLFVAIAILMFSLSNLGTTAYIYKFFPYYNDRLKKKENDQFAWALLLSIIGFTMTAFVAYFFKDVAIRKFGHNSALFIHYYYWIFPFGLGLTVFSIMESIGWQFKRSTTTNFLREVLFRGFTTILITCSIIGLIKNFDLFIKLYAMTYLMIALILMIHLIIKNEFSICFKVSIITRKFRKKILALLAFVYGGSLVFAVSMVFDTFLIASVLGLEKVAIYSLAQNIASIIQAPQRGVISSSVAGLSKAWKDKNLQKISTIYKQSSINLLIFSVAIFSLLWLNFSDGVLTFKMQKGYMDAKWVFLFMGMMRIIDMGTGVNAQIIATSTKWKFEFYTGMILVCITLPLNYILTKNYFGVMGPAIANLISFTIYNAIRYWYLKKKFNLEPFSIKSLYTLLLGGACLLVCEILFSRQQGLPWLFIRSISFIVLYGSGTLLLQISSDILPIWQTLKKKTGLSRILGE